MKALIVATSAKMKGGIPAVINAYRNTKYWEQYNCFWLSTHIDRSITFKLLYFIRSFFVFIFIAPFYDIIHIHLSEIPSAKRKFFYFIIGKLYGKKIVTHFHAFSSETTIFSKYQFLYRFIFKNSSKTIVLSNQWKKWLHQSMEIEDCKVVVLFNPCPTINLESGIEKTHTILFAGTLTRRKGYQDLINAFYQISQKKPDWKLIFAGNGEIEEGKSMAIELGLENSVEFPGWISGAEKSMKFQQASIFCLPSYAEGFPMAILDAFSYGLPVVTTPVGGIPDVIVNGKEGFLFSPGDIVDLEEKLMELIDSKSLRDKYSESSFNLSRTVFSPAVLSEELINIYKSLF